MILQRPVASLSVFLVNLDTLSLANVRGNDVFVMQAIGGRPLCFPLQT